MIDDVDDKRRKKPAIPKGFESETAFLQDMREKFDRAVDADEHNRTAAEEDIRFTYGEQWDDTVRKSRESRRKPVLTINRLPAYVAQITNNRLLNETEIKVLPEKDGTKEVAELRQGLIKNIFKNSLADFARDEASKYQVICGIGGFTMTADYESDDVFDQHLRLNPVANPLAIVIDEMSVLPDGGDAAYAFVSDNIPRKVFKSRYPWASESDFDDLNTRAGDSWFGQDAIRIVSYWRMVEDGTKTLVLLTTGETQELAEGVDVDAAIALLTEKGLMAMRADGTPYVREVPKRFSELYICSGANILEGPYRMNTSSLPVYRVAGWELRQGDIVHRWGLTRFLKDPQRLHNYQRSLLAEQMVAAPRNKWVATQDSVSGREKEWRNAHMSDDPLLIYNAEGGRPERIPTPQVDQALLTEAAMTTQDIKDVSNIHEAALGMKSNEVSAKAINARQQMTDLAAYIYQDRLRLAEERCAKNINEVLGDYYDTTRVVTILGPDNKAVQKVINDPSDPMTDVTAGKYAVTVTVGPSSITKRAQAAEAMMAFVNAVPESAALVMDLVAKYQDWPGATEFARRFEAALPPGIKAAEDMTPEQQQQMMEQQQEAMLAKQVELAKAQAEIENLQAQAQERLARAKQAEANAAKLLSDAEARKDDVEGKNLERDFDARMKVVEAAIAEDQREETDNERSDD